MVLLLWGSSGKFFSTLMANLKITRGRAGLSLPLSAVVRCTGARGAEAPKSGLEQAIQQGSSAVWGQKCSSPTASCLCCGALPVFQEEALQNHHPVQKCQDPSQNPFFLLTMLDLYKLVTFRVFVFGLEEGIKFLPFWKITKKRLFLIKNSDSLQST